VAKAARRRSVALVEQGELERSALAGKIADRGRAESAPAITAIVGMPSVAA